MRFHLPALKGQPVLKANSSCAYTQKIWKFARMMRELGHETIVYGGGPSDVQATEYVDCYPEIDVALGWTGTWAAEDWRPANLSAAAAISQRLRGDAEDMLCLISSVQHLIAESLPDLAEVEYGIGYSGPQAPYQVYESYFWWAMVMGHRCVEPMNAEGNNYQVVIPNYFDPEDFPLRKRSERGDYLLFVGRLIDMKGIEIAEGAAQRLGIPLLIAGKGDRPIGYGEQVGFVGPEDRGVLMAEAQALFAPTLYTEPFGGVAVEAQMCGTPVITNDWGAFVETVKHGYTGWRCRTMGEFTWAVENLDQLWKPAKIRKRAVANYSCEALAPRYEAFFEQVRALRTGQDWLSDWEGLSMAHRYGEVEIEE